MEKKSFLKRIQKNVPIIFAFSLCLLSILFYIVNAFTDGETLHSVYVYGEINGPGEPGVADAYSDYYNSLRETYVNPYSEAHSIYPPMAELTYMFLSKMIPLCLRNVENLNYMHYVVGFILFHLICIFVSVCCVRKILYKESMLASNAICFAFLLSAPLMYVIERGNILILSLMLTLLFVCFYNHSNNWVRELSYVCLALAFSVKIYPAIFGILLIKRKDIGGIVRTTLYGTLSIVLPFALVFEISNLPVWLKNLTNVDSVDNILGWGNGYYESLFVILTNIGKIFFRTDFAETLISVISVLVFALLALAMFISKRKWLTLMAATLLLVLIPKMSFYYSLLFLWIPLVVLMADEKERERKENVPVFVLALFVLTPWALPDIVEFAGALFKLSYAGLVYNISLLLMTIYVIGLTISDIWISYKSNK